MTTEQTERRKASLPAAMVTGASRGIGAATAKRLAVDGFRVCVKFVNNYQAADKVVAEIAGGR